MNTLNKNLNLIHQINCQCGMTHAITGYNLPENRFDFNPEITQEELERWLNR